MSKGDYSKQVFFETMLNILLNDNKSRELIERSNSKSRGNCKYKTVDRDNTPKKIVINSNNINNYIMYPYGLETEPKKKTKKSYHLKRNFTLNAVNKGNKVKVTNNPLNSSISTHFSQNKPFMNKGAVNYFPLPKSKHTNKSLNYSQHKTNLPIIYTNVFQIKNEKRQIQDELAELRRKNKAYIGTTKSNKTNTYQSYNSYKSGSVKKINNYGKDKEGNKSTNSHVDIDRLTRKTVSSAQKERPVCVVKKTHYI